MINNDTDTKKTLCEISTSPIKIPQLLSDDDDLNLLFNPDTIIESNSQSLPFYYPIIKDQNPMIQLPKGKMIRLPMGSEINWEALMSIEIVEVLFISPPWSSQWPNNDSSKFHPFDFEDFTNLNIPFKKFNNNSYLYIWTIDKDIKDMTKFLLRNGTYRMISSFTWAELKPSQQKKVLYERIPSIYLSMSEIITQIDDMYDNPNKIMNLLIFEKNPKRLIFKNDQTIISDYDKNDPYKQPRLFVYNLIEKRVNCHIFDKSLRKVEIFSDKKIIRNGWLHLHYPLRQIENIENK